MDPNDPDLLVKPPGLRGFKQQSPMTAEKPLHPAEQFTLTIWKGVTGLWYVTGSMHKGLLVTGKDLGDALAKVPGAWDELIQIEQEASK